VEEPGRASLCLDRLDEALALTPFIFIYTYKCFRDRKECNVFIWRDSRL
jgi:hypothetical protein